MNRSLLNQLRNGGYILFARHGEATIGEDHPIVDFRNCYTQRNLSEIGRREAIYYGQLFRMLRIPVSHPVLSSPFCRTIETAQLSFGRENVQIDPFWFETYMLGKNLPAAEQKRILNSLQSKLEMIPEPGNNQVIIGHSFPEGIGLDKIPNMGTVIIKPLGQGKGFEIVARLSLSDLADLARQ